MSGAPEFKIVVLGDSAVGKTCLVHSFVSNGFANDMEMTIGASFITKAVHTDEGQVNLSVWDTAGQERYRSLIPTYARGAHAAIICFDLASRRSFERLDYWIEILEEFCPVDLPIWIVGTKMDLSAEVMSEEGQAFAQGRNFKYQETSAKLNLNVTDLFDAIAKTLLQLNPVVQERTLKPKSNQEKDRCC